LNYLQRQRNNRTAQVFVYNNLIFALFSQIIIIIIIIIINNNNNIGSALVSSVFLFRFRNNIVLGDGIVSLTLNLQYGGPGYPFLSGSSPLTCLA